MGIFQMGIFWVKISRGLGGGSNLTGKSLTGGNFLDEVFLEPFELATLEINAIW